MMEIVSVNVSALREVDDPGRDGEVRVVRTGIFEEPVEAALETEALSGEWRGVVAGKLRRLDG